MAKNRVIYQSEALFVSEGAKTTGISGHEQLDRVQSANYSFNITRQDINQYGQLAKIGSIVTEAPTVSADFSYYLTNGFNEAALGFYVQGTESANVAEGGFGSGHLADGSGRNLMMSTVEESNDANEVPSSTGNEIIGIGNAYLSDYSVDLSVGSLPTASVSVEAANINVTQLTGVAPKFALPAVEVSDGSSVALSGRLPEAISGLDDIVALRPGDIAVDFANLTGGVMSNTTSGVDGMHVQSVSISLPLSRSPLERLGTKYAYARSVDFPVTATMNINAIVNETVQGSLIDYLANDTGKTITVRLKDPSGANAMKFTMKGCNVVSESFSSSIGSNKSVDITVESQIGGPNDTVNGIFVSGSYPINPFEDDTP